MKSDPRQALAPTWLIVTHLLGAAVMLYFVSYPTTRIAPESPTNNPVINVAELQTHVTAEARAVNSGNVHIKQEIVKRLAVK